MWVGEQRHILQRVLAAEQKAREAEWKGEVKGHAKGKAEGKAEGKTEGKAEMLLRQLCRRFTLPPEVVARVRGADSDLLNKLMDSFVEAKVLTDVFSDISYDGGGMKTFVR
jgi:flagellar biosynthesis/type III secretory pathway protein FliH